jgi:hypothetical protein
MNYLSFIVKPNCAHKTKVISAIAIGIKIVLIHYMQNL